MREIPAEYHRQRLDAVVSWLWHAFAFVATVLALGSLVEAL